MAAHHALLAWAVLILLEMFKGPRGYGFEP